MVVIDDRPTVGHERARPLCSRRAPPPPSRPRGEPSVFRNPTTAQHPSHELGLIDFSPLTFDLLDSYPYVCRLMSAIPPCDTGSQDGFRNELQRLAWRGVIHHDWHFVSVIRSQGPVNGGMVMHFQVWQCFQVPQAAKSCPAVWR